MSRREALEPERYELFEGPAYVFGEPSRRALLQALGGGVLVVCLLRALPAQESGRRGRGESEPDDLGAWLHVGADGKITAFSGKAEVGQGTRTALTVVVAEELGLAPEAVELVMADTALVPYDRGTFGSRSMPDMAPQLARAAAAMRELLVDLAQERWQTERASITLAGGRIVHPDGKQALTFAELTQGRELVKSISDAPVTAPDAWKVRGKPARRAGANAVVTGTHRYSSDMRLPGMLYGKVLRPASFGAKLVSVDLDAARAIAGVTAVQDGDFVGVAAPDEPTAERALQALKAKWEEQPQPSHRELFELLKQPPSERSEGRGRGGRSSRDAKGSIERGLELADVKLAATYTVAYIAHAPLETRAALAEWQGDTLNVWTGTQRPFGVREELARAFSLSEEKIRVRVPDTGSGYGGKHSGEAALEAARLARAAKKPVKVVWTREEEFTWAYLRPAGVIEVASGATRDGKLTAWRFHNYNSGSSAIEPVYTIPNLETEYHAADAPLRQGSYRALAATANHFARETHLDELARELGMDPLALRLANLEDPRQRAVLEAAAQRFGWGSGERAAGHGVGIACGFEKGGYVATCAQVEVSDKGVRVERLVAAFECGAIVEPAGLETQVEGALIMGIGGALFEHIEFENGRILNPRFSRYRVPRFTDVPKIETVLLDRRDLPSEGAGEAPIVAVAPAIGNAIFDASGQRRRALPMV